MVKIKVIVDVLVENCWGIVDQSPLTCDDNNDGDCGQMMAAGQPGSPST